jgi:hypothetical protein
VARHRRPVNVRDDGLTAVLGPLITVGGVERAVLLDVDSGMVLDAWTRGEASSSDSAVPGTGSGDHGPASGAGSAQSDETVPDGAMFGAGSAPGLGPEPGGAPSGSGSVRSDETVPGGVLRPGFGSLWRSLHGDHPADPVVDRTETPGDVEAFGARHADLVRALLALPGSPPAELSLVVDDRHHLLRCVADPAGGRLALAVVVAGSPWVVRRVRRHLRQLPDAGLTTGPWLLTWAVGPPPTPWPPAEQPLLSGAAEPVLDERAAVAVDGRHPLAPAEWPPHDGWPAGAVDDRQAAPADPHPLADGVLPPSLGEPWSEPAHDGSDDPAAAVPDPRRGPAPPSALPPARSAGGR